VKHLGDEVKRELGRFGPEGGISELVEAWPSVVGETIAQSAWPARVARDGTLHVNTADSMIGHRSPRYIDFGWAAARLDDLVNLPCSRLTGCLFAAAAGLANSNRGRTTLTIMMRDARKHASPNAGWPESALAGALGIRLGGPRSYDGRTVDLATMGDGRADLEANDIRRGLKLYGRALAVEDRRILEGNYQAWWKSQPPGTYHVFTVEIDSAAFISWDNEKDKMTVKRWSATLGLTEATRHYP